MLALQKTEGYIQLALEPPSIDEQGVRHFEIMNVTFDPEQISSEKLGQIISQSSGLTVTEIEPREEGR